MVRKCPYYTDKLHRIVQLSCRGKEDSLVVHCACGETEVWAEWFGDQLLGWELTPETAGTLTRTLSIFYKAVLSKHK